jgi:hypothetical protein
MTDEEMLKLREQLERERANLAEITAGLGERDAKLGEVLSRVDKILAQIAAEIEGQKLDRRTAGKLRAVLAVTNRELVKTTEILTALAHSGDTDAAYGS